MISINDSYMDLASNSQNNRTRKHSIIETQLDVIIKKVKETSLICPEGNVFLVYIISNDAKFKI